MPIKRIQFRGISRTPSDRMTEDGGCAESLNMRIDSTELAPVVQPKPINDELDERGKRMFPPEDAEYPSPWECVYLHKTNSFRRAILVYGEDDAANVCIYNEATDPEESGFITLFGLEQDEYLQSVSSIGNMLIIVTDQRTERLLYVEGQYRNLGDAIPFPTIIVGDALTGSPVELEEEYEIPPFEAFLDAVYKFDGTVWNEPTYSPYSSTAVAQLHAEGFASKLKSLVDQLDASQDAYSYPVFTKYSLVLYDGSEIASDAFLLYPSRLPLAVVTATSDMTNRVCNATVEKQFYNIIAFAKDNTEIQTLIDDYSDVVRAVRFYITQDIRPDAQRTHTGAYATLESQSGNVYNGRILFEYGMTRDVIDNADNFYLLKEVELSDVMSSITLPYFNNTDRVVRQRLNVSIYDARNQVTGGILSNYNGRMLLAEAKEKLNAGVGSFPGYQEFGDTATWTSIKFYYVVNDGNGDTAVVEGNTLENVEGQLLEDGLLASYVTYANVNCKKVIAEFIDGAGTHYFRIAMREHPHMNMSYFVCLDHIGFAKMLQDVYNELIDVDGVSVVSGVPEEIQDLTEESGTINRANRVYLTSYSNPFVFEQSQQFSDSVVGLAPLTKPLSTGQVGQFALYVFTLGGVYSIGIGNDGSFVNRTLVSRDVCRYPRTITQLDQAIAYLTDRGLMLMTGSDVSCLSDNMNGLHYTLEAEAAAALAASPWSSLISTIASDDTAFMEFMRDAEIGYDYAGARLICFNKEETYAYVYELKSATWHKISVGAAGRTAWRTVNAYPYLWVNEVSHNEFYDYKTKMLDYSTFLEDWSDSAAEPMLGVQISRPFDLDESDIRKVIKSVRVRGQYNKGDVKYMLLGSMDGINYRLMHSLRGSSFKLFRIVLLTSLTPHERLSWLDVDYETRFTNRLR